MKYLIKVSVNGEVQEIIRDLPIHESSGPTKILAAAKEALAKEPGKPILLSTKRVKRSHGVV